MSSSCLCMAICALWISILDSGLSPPVFSQTLLFTTTCSIFFLSKSSNSDRSFSSLLLFPQKVAPISPITHSKHWHWRGWSPHIAQFYFNTTNSYGLSRNYLSGSLITELFASSCKCCFPVFHIILFLGLLCLMFSNSSPYLPAINQEDLLHHPPLQKFWPVILS